MSETPFHPEIPIISAEDAISRSVEIDDDFDRLEFLTAWLYGDWPAVREFLTHDLKELRPELRR